MPFKNPNLTIESAGGLPMYVDAFLAKRGIPNGWQRFSNMMTYRYISTRSRAKELGIAINTFKNWEHLYREMEHDGS